MYLKNQIALNIPSEDIILIKDAFNVLKTKLSPHLINISVEERREAPKVGDITSTFINKAMMYIQTNPEMVPPYINIDDIKLDLEAVKTLKELLISARQISELLDDTILLAGSEAYVASLAYYNYIKGASKIDMPDSTAIYDGSEKKIPRSSKKDGF